MRKTHNEYRDLAATFAKDCTGTTAIEYAVIAAGIAMAVVLSR
jgi:Flp pilus assembly pilin Flp